MFEVTRELFHEEMAEAVFARVDDVDLAVLAAAVADFTPKTVATQKIKKTAGAPVIELTSTTDILLTLGQRIDIRRHLGVPFAGLASSGMTMGIRTIFEAGQLEFYMLNLQPAEESVLTGSPYGSIRMYGNVIAGQVTTVTINGTPIVYTSTAADAAATDPRQSVAINIANAINSLVFFTGSDG